MDKYDIHKSNNQAIILGLECGCNSCNIIRHAGHIGCSAVPTDLLELEENGIIERVKIGSIWCWQLKTTIVSYSLIEAIGRRKTGQTQQGIAITHENDAIVVRYTTCVTIDPNLKLTVG